MDIYELRKYFLKVLNSENKEFEDSWANDLQIDCENKEIKKIAFGVSASLELFKKAKEVGADVILVHHGLGLSDKYITNSVPTKLIQKRLKFLYQNNISLFGFHYLLDKHLELGNNVLILKNLGLKNFEEFGKGGKDYWGWSAEFDKEVDLNEIFNKVNEMYLGNASIYDFGKKKIKSIGIVSGGGHFIAHEAAKKGIDLLITGEVTEGTQELARESELNLIWGGHYITERIGVLALMEKVKKDLRIECEFIEVMNKI